ncbi:hypothetical protein DRO55_01075 [Candidatus Bathyarchaeota archaeon]|nr:MAG: hypothetical protein DRO55_01075 [Candidatus Bathyarchaeota archaeon]
MREVTQGRLLFAVSVITMIVYFWALFLSPQDEVLLGRSISDWALLIPVMIFVYLFLFVVAWIGWTMATTPPPLPVLKRKRPQSEGEGGEVGEDREEGGSEGDEGEDTA